jgi:polysaccharide biosynthesis PFTS motif protein
MFAQLRGAKMLREREDPFFVINTISDLAEVQLGLETYDFPKILVGSHAANAEIVLRQYFLMTQQISPAIMQSLGSGKAVASPIPPTWVEHLVAKGVDCSPLLCQAKLYLYSLKNIITSISKFLYLAVQMNNPKYPGGPYVVFLGLQQDNLPGYDNGRETRDLITWYKNSIIRKSNIRKIWAQAKVDSEYERPNDMVISRVIFPKFNSISACFKYYSIAMAAIFISLIGVIRGKWWYGAIIAESINLHYVKFLKKELLAEEYYFTNSNWFYKPLWTYEVEKSKKIINQLYYSTNNENIESNDFKCNITPGFQIMKWNRFIVWDQQQEDHFKQYCQNSEFIRVGYVDFTGVSKNHNSVSGKKILSIFDVTPCRPITFTKLGIAIPNYYSEELNIKFIQDIKELFSDEKWIILWKPKRIVGTFFISEAFKRKQSKLINGNLIKVNPGIAASSLVENSDAVISMPFSSPSVIAKFKDVPCIFYDAFGSVRNQRSRGIPLLRSKVELKEWFESLVSNRTLGKNDRKYDKVS